MFVNRKCWLGSVPAVQSGSVCCRSDKPGPAEHQRDLRFDHDIAGSRYVCRTET
jgi:hypothetical protein